MTDYGTTWSARPCAQEQRGERGMCLGRKAAEGTGVIEAGVPSLGADRVLWARGEVLALRRRASRRSGDLGA